ncbi:unnamed protein product [Clonostachys rosea f. rosea IK726]|uniref:Uncharacterized protein n=2 Tax=Clonostachys rosea f. rosea IK726 TaxID=1349383 RepID=A0ACA9UK79_BIOOC|nr:unnamed protein product [Clonostachys rosea f. rosea IK726]CAG9952828.1 unnamed protein product [Clonostachys rosea f. rosea IK726]
MVENIDLLIVGAGPAGLMAAAWAAVYGIKTKVVDKRTTKIEKGHADGLQSRTIEILHSFGFGDGIYKEANRLQEVCFWNPDENGVIRRTDRIADTIPKISRFQQSVIHQGRIEQYFLEFVQHPPEVCIDRGVEPAGLEIDKSLIANEDAYPITVTLKRGKEALVDGIGGAEDDSGEESVVGCKYMIGCDGAHSWVREKLGIMMEGAQTESVWGVMDILPITDFPDIRSRCTIHSASAGTIMVIPRERGLVRLYIQLAHLTPARGERFDKSNGSPETIFAAAKRIMAPYDISYNYCEWWTVYQVGQRVANAFAKYDRIFLAGDAVHTHSPKAGQGMNVSMHDSYNLVWKIASVIKRKARPLILSTYATERRAVALQLIEFDRRFSRMFSGRPAKDIADEAGISMEEFKRTFEKGNIFTSGISVKYGTNVLVDSMGKPEVAFRMPFGGLQLGMRFPSSQVACQADATPIQLGDALKSDGLWRLIVFAGEVTQPLAKERLDRLGDALLQPHSFLRRLQQEVTLEPVLVHASSRQSVELFDFPKAFYSKKDGQYDYYRVFADDATYHHGHGNAYSNYGVDKESGCAVLTRPDQYIGWMGEVDDVKGMERYLSAILR